MVMVIRTIGGGEGRRIAITAIIITVPFQGPQKKKVFVSNSY